VPISCEHGNETSSSITGFKFLKKYFPPYCWEKVNSCMSLWYIIKQASTVVMCLPHTVELLSSYQRLYRPQTFRCGITSSNRPRPSLKHLPAVTNLPAPFEDSAICS
jgi:hypothetical protein